MSLNEFINDPNLLPWLIPVGPLLAFFIIILATNRGRLARRAPGNPNYPDYDGMPVPEVTPSSIVLSVAVGWLGVMIAWVLSLITIVRALGEEGFGEHVFESGLDWLATGATALRMGVMVDPLTTVMLMMVPFAVTMIFIYSAGYSAGDPRKSRFFAYISLFAGAMLTLVVADNLLLLFVGWEIMGLCSYLLIGFWFEKKSAYDAAVKAFTTTRVADVLMLLGIAYLYAETGTLSFRTILRDSHLLEELANQPAIILGGSLSAAALMSILLIIGTVGKSAQFPLHVWLPDAMEGPTPVSAMIHAAAMVSAGVYMLIRMFPLFEAGSNLHGHGAEFAISTPLIFMAIIGGFTALFAATIAVAQDDVKRVLAYSTISQLGFMVAALGIGAYVAAAFHLITHAFFKALLFMSSGAVIHAMEHGEHHVHEHHDHHHDDEHHAEHDEHAHFDPQDMMNMGGLSKKIPWTFWPFLIGGLSLAGFPLLTAGFWSKDEILAEAWLGLTEGFGPHTFVFITLVAAAFLTAFYTMRQLALTFAGEPRTEEAEHASLTGSIAISMQLPLVILAFFALTAGFVGVPTDFPVFGPVFADVFPVEEVHVVDEAAEGGAGFGGEEEAASTEETAATGEEDAHAEEAGGHGDLKSNWFHHFISPTLIAAQEPPVIPFNVVPVLFSFAVALGGLFVGWAVYWRNPLETGQEDPLIGFLGRPLHNVLKNKYYIDEAYDWAFVRPIRWFSEVVVNEWIDKGLIDGILHTIAAIFTFIGDLLKVLNTWLIDGVGDGIPHLIAAFSAWFRRVQSGRIQQYLLIIMAAAILIGLVFAFSTGILTVSAAG
ncbi:MAG: NADH-quinone oxidoreductase subunit L [Chloroflexi bacterium]|nr:MAG: NADH-quinone oxidoreductase subunit L [Chloroflexota bacterium]